MFHTQHTLLTPPPKSMDIWVVSRFYHLQRHKHSQMYFFQTQAWISLGCKPRSEVARQCQTVLQSSWQIYSPISDLYVDGTSSPKFTTIRILYAPTMGIEWHLSVVLIGISLITKIEHLFICLCNFVLNSFVSLFFHFCEVPLTSFLPSFPLAYLSFFYSSVGVPQIFLILNLLVVVFVGTMLPQFVMCLLIFF